MVDAEPAKNQPELWRLWEEVYKPRLQGRIDEVEQSVDDS